MPAMLGLQSLHCITVPSLKFGKYFERRGHNLLRYQKYSAFVLYDHVCIPIQKIKGWIYRFFRDFHYQKSKTIKIAENGLNFGGELSKR